jgi:hypothetical protein
MTEEEIVYDIMMEASGFKLSDDAKFDEYDYVRYLVKEKRARVLREAYRRNSTIYSEVVQDLYDLDVTKVNAANDHNLVLDLEIGKISVPAVVGFHKDTEEFSVGIRRVSTLNKRTQYFQTSLNKFQNILELGGMRKLHNYFFKVGNEIYIYPYIEKINVLAVLEDPIEGFVNDNEYKSVLVSGTSYTVKSGTITHNSINYQDGDIFTASATTFTGDGKVVLTNTKRAMTKSDDYPLSMAMIKQIKEEIYRNELQINRVTTTDARNDSTDTTTRATQ